MGAQERRSWPRLVLFISRLPTSHVRSAIMSRVALLAFVAALHIAFGKNTTPEQIHIALAGKDASGAATGMRIAWYTQDLPSSTSMVKFGSQPGALDQRASATNAAVQYLAGYGFHHVVTVVGLAPGTKFYYAVGSDTDGWSGTWSFNTAPSGPAAAKAQISVSVFGDMGYKDSNARPMEIAVAGLVKNWSATVTRARLEALKGDIDMVWHVGDIAYSDDAFAHALLGFTYEKCYNGFMNWMQNLSATMPYMVSPGNHESECHSPSCILSGKGKALSNFSAYNARWHMPSAESVRPGTRHSMWYSWNYGPVHFVSVNTETDFPGAGEENKGDSGLLPAGHFGADGEYLRWLEADLKAAAEARASGKGPHWIVAGGHRPYGDIKREHVPLFEKYGVDLYVAGHGHSYSRGTPVNGTTYIMVGGAGCDEMPYLAADDDTCVASGSEKACDPDYAVPRNSEAYKTSQIATGVLKADANALEFQLIDSRSGKVLDEVKITAAPAATSIV